MIFGYSMVISVTNKCIHNCPPYPSHVASIFSLTVSSVFGSISWVTGSASDLCIGYKLQHGLQLIMRV